MGLIGRRLGSRARGDAVVEDSTIPFLAFLVPPEPGQVDREAVHVPPGQPPSLLQTVLKAGHFFSEL